MCFHASKARYPVGITEEGFGLVVENEGGAWTKFCQDVAGKKQCDTFSFAFIALSGDTSFEPLTVTVRDILQPDGRHHYLIVEVPLGSYLVTAGLSIILGKDLRESLGKIKDTKQLNQMADSTGVVLEWATCSRGTCSAAREVSTDLINRLKEANSTMHVALISSGRELEIYNMRLRGFREAIEGAGLSEVERNVFLERFSRLKEKINKEWPSIVKKASPEGKKKTK